MKRSSRAINIFSMSALDLFASALGAFILIAIVLFPYFPTIGNLPDDVTTLQAEMASARQELQTCKADLTQAREEAQAAQEALQEAEAELQQCIEAKIDDIDVVIAFDVTGSMRDEIEGLKSEVAQLVDILEILAPTVGIGIVAFGDRYFQNPTTVQPLLEITNSASNLNTIQRFVNRLHVNTGLGSGDNSDYGEAIDLALEKAVNMAWRNASSRKYIVVITDDLVNPARVEYTYRLARDFSSKPGHFISVVAGVDQLYAAQTQAYLRSLADNGKGEFVDTGGSIVGSVLVAILSK